MTTIFIVNLKSPVRQIIQREAELVMRKLGWAQVKGRRHLLGASAFFSAVAARRAKLALLLGCKKNLPVLQWVAPYLAREVQEQLKNPAHRGWQVRVAR